MLFPLNLRIEKSNALTIAVLLWLLCVNKVTADELHWNINLDGGAAWQSRNDVQIPGDSGTRFSLVDIAGSGPLPFYRLELSYTLKPRHSLRFLYAPFEYTETGTLDKDVVFVDQTFDVGESTEATYRFNSYRATYRYLWHDGKQWQWHVGFTAKIRDAEIALQQEGKSAKDSNVGFVPLLNLYGEYSFAPRWRLLVDFDGLAGPQGRAVDLGLLARYDVARRWYVGAGYRTLEGGADNDEVYNFAWIHYASVSAGYRF
jgi:hypothetical protein